MSKCKKCGRRGLFFKVDPKTGLCSDCLRELERETIEPPRSIEPTIEIPTVYIGNGLKCRLSKTYKDVELQRPDSLPDFNKISCCDNVEFVVENDVVVAKRICEVLGCVGDKQIAANIISSIDEKRPIFSQILGYDDETGEIHLVIALYRVVNYDYDSYAEDNDDSLADETVGYF